MATFLFNGRTSTLALTACLAAANWAWAAPGDGPRDSEAIALSSLSFAITGGTHPPLYNWLRDQSRGAHRSHYWNDSSNHAAWSTFEQRAIPDPLDFRIGVNRRRLAAILLFLISITGGYVPWQLFYSTDGLRLSH
jgi:hypothetical protein